MFSIEMINEGIYYPNDILLLRTFINLHDVIYIYIPDINNSVEDEISKLRQLVDVVLDKNLKTKNLFILPAWIEEDGSFNQTSNEYTGQFLHLFFPETIRINKNGEPEYEYTENEEFLTNYYNTLQHWANPRFRSFDESGIYKTKSTDWAIRPNHSPMIRDVGGFVQFNQTQMSNKPTLTFDDRYVKWNNHIVSKLNYGNDKYKCCKWLGLFLNSVQNNNESFIGGINNSPSFDHDFHRTYQNLGITFTDGIFMNTYNANIGRFKKEIESYNNKLMFFEQLDLSGGIKSYLELFDIRIDFDLNLQQPNRRRISN